MIYCVSGNLLAKLDGRVVIETGGIGYEISVPDNCDVYRRKEGETVMVYTAMLVKEDDVSLCGFSDRESLSLFRKLLTVGGVGAKAAMSVLSVLPPSELKKAIVFGDAAMLTRANGIGKKSAERIILELKDKLELSADSGAMAGARLSLEAGAQTEDPRAQAAEALVGLGYSRAEAFSAVAGVSDDGLGVEEYIKRALKRI
ncbi:MAG: Holliday junction branch migration protein RuvA [Clostridiales Family XIII bacterium]|jgi:Holliday junction DNA helicase RuvA|nr:Holliday junction branch migration protein RuvA [Clostridiales Family XIII bacterium]